MAIGVPETAVFEAADAVLARGERPTVERVRLELGRGSPARVGALLDQWWEQLAGRLRGETRLPGLPGEVAQAFIAIWQQATTLAQAVVEQSVAAQRQVLAEEREQLAVAEEQARRDVAAARQQAAEAITSRQAADTRLADLERLLEQRQSQINDLQQQRQASQEAALALQKKIQGLQQTLLEAQQRAEAERVAQQAYTRGVEDRAHAEVDRARGEAKLRLTERRELQRQLELAQGKVEETRSALNEAQREATAQLARAEAAAEQGARQLQAMEVQLSDALRALEVAQHAAVAQQARAETLEAQLAHLRTARQRKSAGKAARGPAAKEE